MTSSLASPRGISRFVLGVYIAVCKIGDPLGEKVNVSMLPDSLSKIGSGTLWLHLRRMNKGNLSMAARVERAIATGVLPAER